MCVYIYIYIMTNAIFAVFTVNIDDSEHMLLIRISIIRGSDQGGVNSGETSSPPTKSSGFEGFDSSRLLILRDGNSHVRRIL